MTGNKTDVRPEDVGSRGNASVFAGKNARRPQEAMPQFDTFMVPEGDNRGHREYSNSVEHYDRETYAEIEDTPDYNLLSDESGIHSINQVTLKARQRND